MKKVIDLNGNEIEVSIDTPVKTKNGVHYLLTQADQEEVAAREAEWNAGAEERRIQAVLDKRACEYPIPRNDADAFWHYLDGIKTADETTFNALKQEVQDWYNACLQVKINNPK